ncbi:MAG: radical SAM protein [Bdellovibrionales bacterium]|nr:radical SAM protein [Bdellovibrionales bacterium]
MGSLKVLSLIPPLVQVNTPYPATSFITGFLEKLGYLAVQDDLGLKLVLRLLSGDGLEKIKASILARAATEPGLLRDDSIRFFLDAYPDYVRTVGPVISFLQGKDPTLAHRIAARTLLPEGPRFQSVEAEDLAWAFGLMGTQDQAKHLASLYVDDLTDVISKGLDPEFSLSRYGEKLAASAPTFDPLLSALRNEGGLIAEMIRELALEIAGKHKPDVVLITIPFPGCVLGALRIAKAIKSNDPGIKICLGGGYVNTELRKLKDGRIFDFVDAITLDDGERPLELLLRHFLGEIGRDGLLRTYLPGLKVKGSVEYCHSNSEHDHPQIATGFPTLRGLPIGEYLSLVEMLNPMHRFWSDLHWNKVMLAHGCYWHQCSFCDISLDYIKRYELSPVEVTIERMKRLKAESGSSGFHFVDEAAPPVALKDLSKKLIEEGLSFSWWGNIRFEKTFTRELTALMSDAGCVAVSGGLEVASDRLLKKMKKGVTVEQVARVTRNFRESGVLVHAYLMYGFPTQTVQETIDSLERVRQLFSEGCLSSAFWHRFSTTAHSAVGLAPEEYGVKLREKGAVHFAENDLEFEDSSGVDHDRYGFGLRKAVYNYMLGIGLDQDVRTWFDFKVPKSEVDPGLVRKALSS